MVEGIALIHAIRWAHLNGYTRANIRGDCLPLIQKVLDQEEDLSEVGHTVGLIKDLLSCFQSFSFVLISRSLNVIAHNLATVGSNQIGITEWFPPFPATFFPAVVAGFSS